MKKHPIDRPKNLSEKFGDVNIETIRNYVKEWKKDNKTKIIEYSKTLASKYVSEMDLDYKIGILTINLMDNYILNENPSLNMEWKGLIAGAIYLACLIEENPISQIFIAKFMDVDDHTISKRYREISESIDLHI
jgi:transcription initiation factor TFIIIB Brf1 subunit/transcription initiation factor TFIIB